MSELQRIVDSYPGEHLNPKIKCVDGFILSVQASDRHYCTPRPASEGWIPIGNDRPRADYAAFTAVEVGFPSARPEPWAEWEQYCESPDDPTETVYAFVPVELVARTIEMHGGEKP